MSTEHEALLFDRVQHWKARAAAAEAREAALMKNVQWARDCMMDYVVGHYSSTYTPDGLVIECTAPGARGQVHVEPAKRVERREDMKPTA